MTVLYWGAWPDYGPKTYNGWSSYAGQTYAGSPLNVFEDNIGKNVLVAHWGAQWLYNGRWQAFSTSAPGLLTTWNSGRLVMLDWGSWDLANAGNNHFLSMANIIAGTQTFGGVSIDGFLHQFARDVAAYRHPFFIRMWHEMNAVNMWSDNNFPWAIGNCSAGGYNWTNSVSDWKTAWQKIVGIFQQEGATNATFIWCPNVVGTSGSTSIYTLAQIVPNLSTVHWLGVDGYNQSDPVTGPSLVSIFRGGGFGLQDTWAQLHALDASKYIMICEFNCVLNGNRSGRASWYTDAIAQLKSGTSFPNLGGFNFFWWNSAGYSADGDGTGTSNADLLALKAALA